MSYQRSVPLEMSEGAPIFSIEFNKLMPLHPAKIKTYAPRTQADAECLSWFSCGKLPDQVLPTKL